MSKGLFKTIIFTVVFLCAVVIFGVTTNHVNEDLTTEMKAASLPVVDMYYEGEQVNELFGYKSEMEALYMRDAITPIGTDRILPIRIQTYGYEIDEISYEIRSMDTSRLVADAQVDNYTNEKGSIQADLEIENLLEEGQEYLFILQLINGDEHISYYTRIMEPADCYVEESVDFVLNFHETTFNKATAGTLATYVEPNSSGDNSTLNHVTIHSTLNQITWADFEGQRLSQPTISIKEINTSYNVILLSYVMTSTGDGGELEYYNVTEYYRVRYTSDRMYLLNYEREMNQIFRGENSNFYENQIQLGIRSGDVEYVSNETGSVVSFIQEGELWCYQAEEESLSKVFGFRGYEGIDDRENHMQYDIRIIKIDETGSMDFVVSGYMNRGEHEGQVGICIYHFDSVANTVEEEMFLPSSRSYEIMKAELGRLIYENEKGQIYLMFNDSVYEIDMPSLDYKELVGGLKENCYAVSDSHQYIAYMEDTDSNSGETITVLNLEDGSSFAIDAAQGSYVRPLGFMEDDFIYGEAVQTDIITDSAGNIVFPMKTIRIIDTASKEHGVLKSYQKDGYFISDIEIENYTIYLNRIQHNGVTYVAAEQDAIMNREADTQETVELASTVTTVKQTQYQLVLKSSEGEELAAKKLRTPSQIVLEEPRDIQLDEGEGENYYYAYARGEVLTVTARVTEAISVANENMGVVIDGRQNYIWKRARKTAQSTIDVSVTGADALSGTVAKSINAMLNFENLGTSVQSLLDGGAAPKSILIDTMQEMKVLDLTGCSLEETFYYLNKGTPVFAMSGQADAVLLVGYDANNVVIYDTTLGETHRATIEEAAEQFKQNGNVFLAYLKD